VRLGGAGRRLIGATRGWARSLRPERGELRAASTAGLPGAIGSVPDGMAAAALAGVNPIHGLYASMAGPIFGGLFSSTARMVVTTTSAASLAAGSAIITLPASERPAALFMLTLLSGLLMVVASVLRLGRYLRFVSNSVMTGFLTGVAANIILSQVPDLTGADAEGSVSLAKAVDVVTHPERIELASLAIGVVALALLVALARFAWVAPLAALVVPSLIVAVWGLDVSLVSDIGEIVSGIPAPSLPELGAVSLNVVAGAAAVTAIVLVQGSGVSETAPNLDGTRSDANRDFLAQGAGNIAASMFQGQPVGGSVGQTALNLSAGAKTRWASIASGVWMLAILVAFSGLVGKVAMPTLAAVLIVAAVASVKPAQIRLVLGTGWDAAIAGVTTFAATLFLPIAAAVGVGVALSLLLQLNREAMDLRVVELTRTPEGDFKVGPAPAALQSHRVTVLDVFGSLFYAGARTLEARLPDPAGARRPAVVLRLRGRTTLTSTTTDVLAAYAARLDEAGGRLFLCGVEPQMAQGLEGAGGIVALSGLEIVPASDVLGESTRQAVALADAWVSPADDDTSATDDGP
jgi:SulP family sulfate permease